MAGLYDGLEEAPRAAPRVPVSAPPALTNIPAASPAPAVPAGLYDDLEEAGPKTASGLMEHVQAGFQGSVPGLAWRRKLPELVMNPETAAWWERAATGITQVASELGIMIPAGAKGAVAGGAIGTAVAPGLGTAVGGVLGGGAAMFAVPAAIRTSLIEAYKARDAAGPADWFNIVREVATHTAKEGVIGAATMGVGGIAARTVGKAIAPSIGTGIAVGTATKTIGVADVAAQIATMTTMPAAFEGRLPSWQEFMDGAIVIGGLKAGHSVAARMMNTYEKTGKTPAEQVADAKADPAVAEDLTRPEVSPTTGTASGVPVKLDKIIAEAEFLARGGVPEAPNIRAIIKEIKDAGPQQGDMIRDIERIGALADQARAKPLDATERAELETLRTKIAEAATPEPARAGIPREAVDASAQRVHEDVLRQVKEADQARRDSGLEPIGDDHAAAVAALVRARVRTRAERLGMLPEDVYRERPLQIRDDTAAALKAAEAAIPADAPRFTPPEVDLFGAPIPPQVTPRYGVENLATREVPLADLVLSKEVPQFKAAADAEGVVVPLGGKFDRTGVGPVQIWERLDGTMEVISGRHRLDLARRSGESTIPAQVHREADGFDAARAARLDAELNIREEQGSVADYVQYFKASGQSKEAADAGGLLARAKGQKGFAIARDGSPDLLASHRAGQLSDEAALSLSTAAPGSERLQALGIAMVQQGKSILISVNTMRAVDLMAAERQAAGAQGDIFGFDDSAMLEASAMAKRVSSIQRKISEQINAVAGAAKRPEIARDMGVDVTDPEGIQKRIVALRQEQFLWDNWPLHPELVAKLRGQDVTGREGELRQGPPPAVDPFPETPAEAAARDAEATAQATRKLEQQAAADRAEAEVRTAEQVFHVEREDGAPLLSHGKTAFVEPQVFDRGTDGSMSYEHVVKVGGEDTGVVSLTWKDGQITQLHNIRTFSGKRDRGFGTSVLRAILTHNRPETTLWLRHVLPGEAREWWGKRGATFFEVEGGEDGTLTRSDFEAANPLQRGDRQDARAAGEGEAAQDGIAAGGERPSTVESARESAVKKTLFQSLEEYGGQHRPPGREDGAPLHDLTGNGRIYPDDVYSAEGARYYGHGGDDVGLDRQTMAILGGLRGKPNAKVTVYRAIPDDLTTAERIDKLEAQKRYIQKHGKVPPNVDTSLNRSAYYDEISNEIDRLRAAPPKEEQKASIGPGDWVTVNRNYATMHGRSALLGNYKVISKTVRADEVFTDGNSIHEFGFWPKGSEDALRQEHRGSYQVAENLITIMQGADKSTVVHELTHSWLEEMKADAARPGAPEQIKADWEIIRRELAIPASGEISRASHEQFARSGERYLAEGRAPSAELRTVFERFKAWLLDIYRDLANLNVKINPDLREVLDRMLATDQEIADARELNVPRAYVAEAKAEEARKIVPGFKAEQVALEPYADELPKGPGEAPNNSHVNYAYVDGPVKIKLTLQRLAEIDQQNIQKHRGGKEGVETWEQEQARMEKWLLDTLNGGEDQLGVLRGGRPDDPQTNHRLRAMKQMMVGAGHESERQRDIILEKGRNATIEEQLQYLSSLELLRQVHAEFLGERAAVARAMNALKDTTEGSAAIQAMMERMGRAETPETLFQSAAEKADADQAMLQAKLNEILLRYNGKTVLDIAKMHKEIGTLKGTFGFAKAVEKATTWEQVVEGWKSLGLLSGPVTHVTNVAGTEAFHFMRPVVDALGSVIGMARGASPGMGESDRASMSEAVARITGMLGGVKDGVKVAVATFKLDDPTGKTESYRTAIPGRAGELIRIPFRLLGAEDALTSTMYKRGELGTLAIRQAFDEGLNPSTREFAERVDQLKDRPTEEMQAIADDAAARMTFNSPLGQKGVALQMFVQKWNLQWMVPFIRTPINIVKEFGRMSAFAPLVGEWRADIAKGGVARDRALAEMALGSGIMALTMAYAFDGSISGAGSPDPGKNRGKAGVWQPYSILIGDTWYEYARIAPTGTLMGMAADIAAVWDHMNDEEKDKVPKMLAVAFSNAVTNQLFLQGITNFVNAISEPGRYGPRFMQQLAGSVVPNIIGQPTTMADPVVREVNSMLEAIQARLPGFRQELLPKRDWLGEPVETKERLGVVGPVREQKVSDDKVRLEAARLDISMASAPKKTHIGKGTGKLGDVELTPEERNKFQEVGGQMAHRILDNIVKAPGYDQMPDLIKRKVFSQVLTASHKVAAVQALPMEKRREYLQSITEKVAQELAPTE